MNEEKIVEIIKFIKDLKSPIEPGKSIEFRNLTYDLDHRQLFIQIWEYLLIKRQDMLSCNTEMFIFLAQNVNIGNYMQFFNELYDKYVEIDDNAFVFHMLDNTLNEILKYLMEHNVQFDIEELRCDDLIIREDVLEKLLNGGYRFSTRFAERFIGESSCLYLFVKYRNQALETDWWITVLGEHLSRY